MLRNVAFGVVGVVLLALGGLYVLGRGWLGSDVGPGTPTEQAIPRAVIEERSGAQLSSSQTMGVHRPKQILFGDLHVHSTYSFDAFLMSLPLAGGDGEHPVSDACDFARYCSALDFWSINDHALALTPKRWQETVDAMRQCNAVAGDPADPDVVAFLGWEWTQVGVTPETHYGHKNVILRDLEDDRIPTRPIASVLPVAGAQIDPPSLLLGVFAAANPKSLHVKKMDQCGAERRFSAKRQSRARDVANSSVEIFPFD